MHLLALPAIEHDERGQREVAHPVRGGRERPSSAVEVVHRKGEHVEHRHERDEAPIAATVYADSS